MATANGGATWKAQRSGVPGAANFVAVSFSDALHGTSVGWSRGPTNVDEWVTITTSDGGNTWTRGTVPSGLILPSGVVTVDAAHAWAVGTTTNGNSSRPVMVATPDGGKTWNLEQTPADATSLNVVTFTDRDHGWAVGTTGQATGTKGSVIATVDGGITWTHQTVPSTISSLADVKFVDSLRGWAVGAGGGGGPAGQEKLLTTTDGGATWNLGSYPQNSYGTGLMRVAFVDAFHGWVLDGSFISDCGCGSSYIAATSDGGKTWSRLAVPSTAPWQGRQTYLDEGSPAFVNSSRGWIVGATLVQESHSQRVVGAPQIWMTQDGGSTWSQQTLP